MTSRVDISALARYIETIIQGSITLARTHQDSQLLARRFDYLKDHLPQGKVS